MKWEEQAQRLLRKARADETAMNTLAGAPNIDPYVIGFHAQQAVEKYLKALLNHRRIAFGRTHDLRTLLELLKDGGEQIPADVEEISRLSPYAVEFRYEDESEPSSTTPDQRWMREHVEAVGIWVLGIIGDGG